MDDSSPNLCKLYNSQSIKTFMEVTTCQKIQNLYGLILRIETLLL